MYRISAIIANENKCNILVNGESIGQVASQTLTSMRAINEVVKMPVIRPVACFDKLEIIDISKKLVHLIFQHFLMRIVVQCLFQSIQLLIQMEHYVKNMKN